MASPAEAVTRLEAAGTDTAERGAVFASLLTDDDLHAALAAMTKPERDAALTSISAALKRAGSIQSLKDAVVAAMRDRVASGPAQRIFGLPMPGGYQLERSHLVKPIVTRDGTPTTILVARRPIAVTGVVEDPAEGRVHVEVTWTARRGKTERVVVPRQAITDGRVMVTALSEAGSGAPVTSTTAKTLVDYFAAQEEAAGRDLPTATLARRMGWVTTDDGDLGYLAGTTLYQDGRVIDTTDAAWTDRHVILDRSGAMPGFAHRVRRGGTMEGWLEAVTRASEHPVPMLCILASLAPVLLHVIPEATSAGILDISGPSETGKSRAVEVGVSCWGPGCVQGRGPAASFEGSDPGIAEYVAVHDYMPLVLNDTQHCRDHPERIGRLVYQLFEGAGRLLANGGGGNRPVKSYRVGAMFTGETPAVDMDDSGAEGVRTRLLTLTEPPWGGQSHEAGALVACIRRDLLQHYGHAGPAFASVLDTHRQWWPELRRRWSERTAHWSVTLGARASRAGEVLALYELAGSIALRHLALPIDLDAVMACAARAAVASVADADLGMRALRRVVSWAVAHQSQLDQTVQSPPGGRLGRWDRGPAEPLAMLAEPLGAMLRQRNMQVEAVLKAWSSAGWLSSNEAGRRTRKMLVGDKQSRCYVLTHEALALAGASSTRGPTTAPLPDLPPQAPLQEEW